jgi:hypothetical protein
MIFGGVACVDPASLAASLTARGVSVERWRDRAGLYVTEPGRQPGRGWILLTKSALDALDLTADHDLVISGSDRDHVLTLSPITFLHSECIDPGSATDPTATYLCEVVDRRHLLGMIPVDKAFNLKTADGTGYYTQTKNGSNPWTWQEIITHLSNTVLGIGTLTLPFTPDATPENLVYWGHSSALVCLCDVLARLGCDLAYDPVANTFAAVRLGVAQDTVLGAITAERLWDGYSSEEARGWRPEKIRVRFPRRPVDTTDGYSPYYVKDVTLAAATGVKDGTYVTLDDDAAALGASGAPSNAAALDTRAAERAADWLRKRAYYDRPTLRIWVDFLPEATGLGAYAVHKVAFDDRGGPFATAAVAEPDGALEAWHPLGGWPVWWPITPGTVPSSQTELGATFQPAADDTWEDTGLSISLPSAGTYFLFGRVTGRVEASVMGTTIVGLLARLYNVTDSAAVSQSDIEVTYTHTASKSNTNTASIQCVVTVSSTKTIRLEAYRNGAGSTWVWKHIFSNPGFGSTHIGYLKTG